MSLCVEAPQLETIQRVLKEHAQGLSVLAFGSRVSGVDLSPFSDLDLALRSDRPIPVERMASIEKAFAASGLPFHIDLLDWAKLPAAFQKHIEKEYLAIA